MNADQYKRRFINPVSSVLAALKQMDDLSAKSLIVVDDIENFIGILSIGDIQRAIINGVGFDKPVQGILRTNPKFAKTYQSIAEIKEQMFLYRMELMPVVSTDFKISAVYSWEELFIEKGLLPYTKIDLPVVIMAGGRGTRLLPLTNVFPKPLIPYGNKTIIEEIINRFSKYSCNNFHISINYKAELIQYYLNCQNLPCKISYFRENMPLGTGGSLSLLKNEITTTFFVTNCDIIVETDYAEILNYHRSNMNEITIVAALMHYPIQYGVLETGNNGKLLKFKEKPEITFKINSGMYILESHLLNEIPDNTFFNITQLIEIVQLRHGNIGVFPISQKSWKDLGTWNDYDNVLRGIHERS